MREKGYNPWEVHKIYNKESRIRLKKQTKNLGKVEKRKIITGSKCMQVHLHTDTVLSLYQILFDISL